MRLVKTVALVTGGGSGIGRAICQRFAREGAMVIAADRILDRAEETAALIVAAGGSAQAVEVDVAESAAVTAMAERVLAEHGRVDVLVNNAGLSMGEDDLIELTIDFVTLSLTPLEFIQLASFLRMSIDGLLDHHPSLQRAVINAFDIRE